MKLNPLVGNTFIVADAYVGYISTESLSFLRGHAEWKDSSDLKEDIAYISNITESDQWNELSGDAKNELRYIKRMCEKIDASHVRLVKFM